MEKIIREYRTTEGNVVPNIIDYFWNEDWGVVCEQVIESHDGTPVDARPVLCTSVLLRKTKDPVFFAQRLTGFSLPGRYEVGNSTFIIYEDLLG